MTREEELFTQPTGSIAGYHTVNPGDALPAWRARHNGTFTEDNPYYTQLQIATDKRDIDALYERAVEWEADYANRQMQLRENREILEEQREYDSPEARIARERAAGINSDIAGSSSGQGSAGSSAQLTNPGMADQQGQNKFSNYYDNTATVLNTIGTVSNFVSGFTGSISGIMNSISNMKLVPSQIKLNEANAGLANAGANEISTLLSGKKKSLDLSNINDFIANGVNLSKLIMPDAEDSAIAGVLNAAGIPEAQHQGYIDTIRQIHKDPGVWADYNKKQLDKKWNEAENAKYTEGIVAGMTDLNYQLGIEQKSWDLYTAKLQGAIAKKLALDDDFASDSADVIMKSLAVQDKSLTATDKSLDLSIKEIEQDTAAFLAVLAQRSKTLTDLDDAANEIQKIADKQGRDITAEEAALINKLRTKKVALRTMYSSQFYQMASYFQDVGETYYQRYHRLDASGKLRPAASLEVGNMFYDDVFNDLITHTKTPGEIAHQWVDTSLGFVGDIAVAGSVYKTGAVNSAATVKASEISAKSRVDAANATRPHSYTKRATGKKGGFTHDFTEEIIYK